MIGPLGAAALMGTMSGIAVEPKTPLPPATLSAIEEWAKLRDVDLQAREFLSSFDLGPTKPLGSFGFAIEEADALREMGFTAMGAFLREKGLQPFPDLATDKHARIWSSSAGQKWLYLWDVLELAALMERNHEVLRAAGWPGGESRQSPLTSLPFQQMRAVTTDFVRVQRERKVRPLTPLFNVVSDAYGDKTNAGRTDVCVGTPRGALFAAFRAKMGFDDPAGPMYFHLAGMPC